MSPAIEPRDRRATKLLVINRAGNFVGESGIDRIVDFLDPSDCLVVNDAATFPANLPIDGGELRLIEAPDSRGFARAVRFGDGNWHDRTEDRGAAPETQIGTRWTIGSATAFVVEVLEHPRLLQIRFDGPLDTVWASIYAVGRPIQYSYIARDLNLWDVQNSFASVPAAAELASAGYGLSSDLLLAIRKRRVTIATVTHAAGISSTGDVALDTLLPLAERSVVPGETLRRISETRAGGGRVIAVGTSVVRALESAALGKTVDAVTTLRIDEHHRLKIVDGLITGLHTPGESHYDLLEAFVSREKLDQAIARAESKGMLSHEFGDALCVLPTQNT